MTTTSSDVYRSIGVRPVVNLRGCATLLGGSLMDAEVLEAYRAAASSFVLMDELAAAADRVIADVTGAEAGYVTSGATAGLSLAAAACLAGSSVEIMNRLPDTSGVRERIVVQQSHRNPYDRALWRVGAKPQVVASTVEAVRDAVRAGVAAAFFAGHLEPAGLPIEQFVELAHEAQVPVIVDAALTLPPPGNLRRWVAAGADLVVFSGGKSIRGPQSSGFIAGRRALLMSVALQHQDMDVLATTWSRRALLADGHIDRLPDHGVGRSMKVGKEELVALVCALRRYVERDHEAEYRQWDVRARTLAGALEQLPGLRVAVRPTDVSARPVPTIRVDVDADRFGMPAVELVNWLAQLDPRILLDDSHVASGLLVLDPENLRDDDIDYVRDMFRTAGANPSRILG